MWERSLVALLVGAALTAAQEYRVEEPTGGEVQFSRVGGADSSLIFDYSEVVVNPRDPLQLDCGLHGEIRYCIWEKDSGEIYQVEDVHGNMYNGLSAPVNTEGNRCGIVINEADESHHGQWTCKIFVRGSSYVGTKSVVVTIRPTTPELDLDYNQKSLMVNNEEETAVRCWVAAARPAATIHWFLDTMEVTGSSQTEETPTDTGGIYKSVSTLRRTFQPADNGKLLICSIRHQTLLQPENTTVPVSVVFAPVEKPVSTFYQIPMGGDYEVKLNFSANPAPFKQEWRYGASVDAVENVISIPSNDGHFATSVEDLGNGAYTAKILITGFSEEDANMEYMLLVENEYGQQQYHVRLSTHEAPQETLSGGAVAGIIIVVVIIALAVATAAYARYTHMFCFAARAESKAHIQDPERTEPDTGTTNHAIKTSTDQVNGKMEKSVANGNGNLEQPQTEDVNQEKKNTDV